MIRKCGLFFAMIGVLGLICAGGAGASAEGLEKRVVIYSTHEEALLELLADAFEDETSVTVDFINLKGALAERENHIFFKKKEADSGAMDCGMFFFMGRMCPGCCGGWSHGGVYECLR